MGMMMKQKQKLKLKHKILSLFILKYLIVGLGNPGVDYENTRHNIGFKTLDAWAQASNVVFEHKRYADYAQVKNKGRIFVLIKPMTYMNLSGKAIRYWLEKEKLTIENMLVIVDDLALPFGSVRIKQNGGAGGHNGLINTIEILGSQDFNRLRFGIGDAFSKGSQVDYVLGEWSENENTLLPERLKNNISAIKSFGSIGIERTMNFFNKKYNPQAELDKINLKKEENNGNELGTD